MPSKQIPTDRLIHLFALAHLAVAILSRVFHYYDDVPLTVLTISMVAVISLRHGLQLEIMALLSLISCFAGFLLGIYGGYVLLLITRNDFLSSGLATFLTTEAMGWMTYWICRRRGHDRTRRMQWSPSTRQILIIAGIVLLLRVGYIVLLHALHVEQRSIYPEISRLFSNTFAVILLLCGNLIYVQLGVSDNRHAQRSGTALVVRAALFELLLSAAITLAVIYRLPFGQTDIVFDAQSFVRLYAIVLMTDIAVFALLCLIRYVARSQVRLRSERNKKHLAQYQYNKLKQQINPHFLFNSLNILDYLVVEGQTQRASAFIRKLACLYRYLLKNEDEPLVSLREELEFAAMYIDLVKERFTAGLHVRTAVPDQAMRRSVVPCSIQQLIENATKHNIVSTDEPLHIDIRVEEDFLVVENNLQPRLSRRNDSTGLGLKNLSQQYADLGGLPPVIEQTPQYFRVKLPLL